MTARIASDEDGNSGRSRFCLLSILLLTGLTGALVTRANPGDDVLTRRTQITSLMGEPELSDALVTMPDLGMFLRQFDGSWAECHQLAEAPEGMRDDPVQTQYGVTAWPLRIAKYAGSGEIEWKLPWHDGESLRLPALSVSGARFAGLQAMSAAGNGSGGTSLDSQQPCAIANESDPFAVVSLAPGGNNGMVLSWESCSDHVYIVQATSDPTLASSWTDVAWMWGSDGTTTWTETNIVGQTSQRLYRVVRASPQAIRASSDSATNGIPYGWAVDHKLDPLDPNLAAEDPDGDRKSNLDEYLAGTDPRDPNNFFHVTSIVLVGNDARVYFTSVSGKSYSLQHKDSFAGEWTNVVENIPGKSGAQWAKHIGGGASSSAWYRVAVAQLSRPLVVDSDGDGIPDWWRQQYFGHPTGLAADHSRASDDADNDGLSNLIEFMLGTDPTSAPPLTSNGPLYPGQTLDLSTPGVAGATYSWTGPDGFSSTNQNPSTSRVTTNATGAYCLALTVSGYTATNCVSVAVTAPPLTSNSPLCPGQTLELSVPTVDGATYSWTGPDGFSSTHQNPSLSGVTTNAAGAYCLVLTISDITSSNCVSVTVIDPPTATVSGSTHICPGASATIQTALTGTPPWTVAWSDGTGTITSDNTAIRTVSPSSTTTYTVTDLFDATCSEGTASGSATVTIDVPSSTITPNVAYLGSTNNTASVPTSLTTLYSFIDNNSAASGIMQGSGSDNSLFGLDNDALFKMIPDGSTVTPLFQFSTSTISNGYAARIPIVGSDGSVYGVTRLGGNSNCFDVSCQSGYGTVYRISTNCGTLATLHVFEGTPEGAFPAGHLVQGKDGSFYGVTQAGGAFGCPDVVCCAAGFGTVFQVTSQGTLTTLHKFTDGFDGAGPIAGLVQGSDGSLYGTTHEGGASGLGTVFKVSTNGNSKLYQILHTFAGGVDDGSTPDAALVQGSDGNLYGTTTAGGTNDLGTVFKVSTNSATFEVLHAFTGGTDGADPAAALVQGSDGGLYGTTFLGGLGYGTIFRITPQGTLTMLYQFTGATDGANPDYAGLVHGSDGYWYGATLNGGSNAHGTVYRFLPSTCTWSILGGTITAGQGSPTISFAVDSPCAVTFSVTATNDFGCSSSGSASLRVSAPAPTSSQVSMGGTLTLSAPNIAGAAYSWTGPNGFTSTDQNPSIPDMQLCDSGQYCVSVTANGCMSDSSCVSVEVSAPIPTYNDPVNAGDTLVLSVPAVAGAAYSWTGPNGFTSSDQNPSIANVQPCDAGDYCLTVATDGCTSDVSCVSVAVGTPSPTNNSPCTGQTLILFAPNIADATYSWTGPNGFTSTDQNPSITNVQPDNSGWYCLTVTADGCTWVSGCVLVTVTSPTATVSGAATNNCPGAAAPIRATLTGAKPWIVTWSDGVTIVYDTNLPTYIVSPYSTANYTITALSDANCATGTVSGSATVVVNAVNPTSSVTVSNEVLVVYNTNVPDSAACKDYYISHRPGFSSANVLGCSCTTTGQVDEFEVITSANLTNQILTPMITFIQSNQAKSIHYVVLMFGMPSRVNDSGCLCTPEAPSVQHQISRCTSTSGPCYEGSTCPFVATNFPGTTCLVTALNMATLADCEGYIDKVASMYTSDVIISAKATGYTNDNYYLDDTRQPWYDGDPLAVAFQAEILAAAPSASVSYSPNTNILTGTDVKGYFGWGYNSGLGPAYATNGLVVWSGNSAWWIIATAESYNGDRTTGQGHVTQWFATNAWGGANYSNTPVGAVSHVDEPYSSGINGPTYMSLWEEDFLFSECAWASKRTMYMQAIGDPLIKQ